MKKLLFAAVLLSFAPTPAHAEHWDVIGQKLKNGCTMGQYMAIVKDFNAWGKSYGYSTTIITPIQDADQATFWWIGKTPNAAKFGAAWDAWRDAQADASSAPAKLQARFDACADNTSRSGYDAW